MKGGIGLDISNGAVTVALLRGSKNFFIDTILQEKIPAPGENETQNEVIGRKLRDIWERYELEPYPVVSCMEAKDCILRQLVVPFSQEEKIQRTIKFEAEKYLHACSIDDVVIDFLKVDDLDGKSGILLAAGHKKVIRDHLDKLQGGGIDPVSIDLDGTALFNAFSASSQYREQGASLVIDIGTEAVRMLLVSDGALKRVRSFRIRAGDVIAAPEHDDLPVSGEMDAFDDDLEKRFAAIDQELEKAGEQVHSGDEGDDDDLDDDLPIALVDEDEFEHLQHAEQETDAGEAVEDADTQDDNEPSPLPPAVSKGHAADSSQLLERILVEVQRTFASVIFKTGVDHVCLTGAGSRLPGVKEFFHESFEMEVEYMDLGVFSAEDTAIEEAELLSEKGAVALGLALRAVDRETISLDFRRDEFKFERRYERLKLPLLFTGLLLFFSVFFQSLNLYIEKESHKESYNNLLIHQAQLFNKTFEKNPLEQLSMGRSVISLLKNEESRLEEFRGKGRGVMPDYLGFLEVMEDLTQAVDQSGLPDLVWVKINVQPEIPKKKTYSAGKIGILADDSASVSKIREAIDQKSKYFMATKPMTSQHKPSTRILCQLSLQYKDKVFQKSQSIAGTGPGGSNYAARTSPGRSGGGSY